MWRNQLLRTGTSAAAAVKKNILSYNGASSWKLGESV
jgi:hypothetical protein